LTVFLLTHFFNLIFLSRGKPGSYLGFINEKDGTSHVAIIMEDKMFPLDSFLKEKVIPEINELKNAEFKQKALEK
jgi:hypothetical protein